MISFGQLRTVSLLRCDRWHPNGIDSWSLSDWATAVAGEVGEACNIIKKLNRIRDGVRGNKASDGELSDKLADEIADAVIYLDLLAARAGIDLGAAVVAKFNRTSEQ